MKSPYSSHIFSFKGRGKNVIVLLYYLQPKKKIIKIGQIIMSNPIRIGIVTVSDRASLGVYQDLGGPAIIDLLHEILSCNFETIAKIIPDEQPLIESTLKELCDVEKCCLVVTTGGTGPAKRDVTPEATEAVCDKILDGFGEQMRQISLQFVPTAILSRQVAVLREIEGHAALIINLPGQPKAISETLEGLKREDGSVVVPEVLRTYMGGVARLNAA
jgi:molybdopterin adenylyltransferase